MCERGGGSQHSKIRSGLLELPRARKKLAHDGGSLSDRTPAPSASLLPFSPSFWHFRILCQCLSIHSHAGLFWSTSTFCFLARSSLGPLPIQCIRIPHHPTLSPPFPRDVPRSLTDGVGKHAFWCYRCVYECPRVWKKERSDQAKPRSTAGGVCLSLHGESHKRGGPAQG